MTTERSNEEGHKFSVRPTTSCQLCAFAEENGYYLPTWRVVWHCERCHATGGGHSELHCVTCCRTFGGETAFTAHQTIEGCRHPGGLITKAGVPRLRSVSRGNKQVWVMNSRGSFGGDRHRSEVGYCDGVLTGTP
jgi:hypothetical protein